MTKSKILTGVTITALAAILLSWTPNIAYADGGVICTDTIDGQVINSNVIIPNGGICKMDNSVINGSIIMEKDSQLNINTSTISGKINGKNIVGLGIAGSAINEININGAEAMAMVANTVSGKVSLQRIGSFGMADVVFSSNFSVSNVHSMAFAANTFDGSASCKNIDILSGDGTNTYNGKVDGCPA